MLERHGQKPGFQLSFDDLDHHNLLRVIRGSEKQGDRAFRLLQERDYEVIVDMCLHRDNKDSIRDTVKCLAMVRGL